MGVENYQFLPSDSVNWEWNRTVREGDWEERAIVAVSVFGFEN